MQSLVKLVGGNGFIAGELNRIEFVLQPAVHRNRKIDEGGIRGGFRDLGLGSAETGPEISAGEKNWQKGFVFLNVQRRAGVVRSLNPLGSACKRRLLVG